MSDQSEIDKLKQKNKELSMQIVSIVEESLVIGFGKVQAGILKRKIEKPLVDKISKLEDIILKLESALTSYKYGHRDKHLATLVLKEVNKLKEGL